MLHILERFGVAAQGLEPRDSRRQLEQQRQELSVGKPQQQLAGQQEQQQRVPLRSAPSSTEVSDDAAADPAAILSCLERCTAGKDNKCRPGVSSPDGAQDRNLPAGSSEVAG